MKVWFDRAETDTCEQISLGKAVWLIHEHHEVGLVAAADMLQLTSESKSVLVDGGAVYISDTVPVLEIDMVLKTWWALQARQLPAMWTHLIISCTKGPLKEETPKVQYVGEDNVFYPNSEQALATFKGQGHVSTTPQSEDTLQHGEEPSP